MKPYDHLRIEPDWQSYWEKEQVYQTPESGSDYAYILDMFPYPSGYGLHVGHMLPYAGSDVLARAARMQGKAVLHPMGWDAFGLPAENFAIKTGVHPAISTKKNTERFIGQLKQVGMSYDWSKELNTSDPAYYKWTQWMFELLYKRGLAYRKEGMVNWCPSCQTVLANEQVVSGRCDRCGHVVEQRSLRQWYFRITDYTERLINDLDGLDWPEKIKAMQRNWIGRSEGAKIWFQVEGDPEAKIEVFTTRPDTLFGVTYVVVAPEHPLLEKLTTSEQKDLVAEYVLATTKKTELERQHLEKKKTGVFSGSYVLNPINNSKVPVWVADYVLASYGTGAVMAVPAHDERDAEFAAVFNLPVVKVISNDGILMNSGEFTGKKASESVTAMLKLAGGESTVSYRLRDWLVSRQRFWGAPIPIAYDKDGNEFLIPESELPVELPMDVTFLPTGQSPLTLAEDWRSYTAPDGRVMTREADTLDGFVCSSWYFLRFPNPQYTEGAFDPTALKRWLPVTMYIGGAEHAVLHLLYARFFTKVLFDAGYLDFDEPFLSLRNQGMILGPDHQKMSKSKGNVINPEDVIREFGADTLRVYELFMGPFDSEKPWNTRGILGSRRFLEKLWRLQEKVVPGGSNDVVMRAVHKAIASVTTDIQAFKFNTAVSSLMEAVNVLTDEESIGRTEFEQILKLVSPLAPHIAEELWKELGNTDLCSLSAWPTHDAQWLVQDLIEYPIQVNGKVRARISLPASLTELTEIQEAALADPAVQALVGGAKPRKIIVVPGRLISLVL